jgi:alpha-beta hydrolase superfamily lysophospholipase
MGPSADLARALASDFTVYTYDRRGRGTSGDTPPYAVQREIEDLAAVLAEAGGSAALYGASSGAALVLDAASQLDGLTSVGRKLESVAHTLPYDGAIVKENQRGTPLPRDRWAGVTVPALVLDGGKSPT